MYIMSEKIILNNWKTQMSAYEWRKGAADIFLEIITQPFLGFDGIVPGSSNQATV